MVFNNYIGNRMILEKSIEYINITIECCHSEH